MDYYRILKVPSNAKQIDLDRAYQKLCKEARYDTTINRKEVEIAYRILSDATQRALYDATLAEYSKKAQTTARIRKKKEVLKRRRKIMISVLAVLFVITVGWYIHRFAYLLKTFEVGDRLYYNYNNSFAGVVKAIDKNRTLGKWSGEAYQIEVDGRTYWIPANKIRACCHEK